MRLSFKPPICFCWCLGLLILVCPSAYSQSPEDLKAGVVKITAGAAGTSKVGTGFVVGLEKDTAYVMTAAHVVLGDPQPQVNFFPKPTQAFSGKVVALEGDDTRDLALIRVDGELPPGIHRLEFEETRKLQGGEPVLFIGFPRVFGTPWAVSTGNLSGFKGRDLTFVGTVEEGHSGGPLFLNGKVIGVITDTRAEFGFAVHALVASLTLHGWKMGTTSQEDSLFTEIQPSSPEKISSPVDLPHPQREENNSVTLKPKIFNTALDYQRMTMVSLAIAPNGRYVVTGGEDHTKPGCWHGHLTVWDLLEGRPVKTVNMRIHNQCYSGRVEWVDFSPDGRYVLWVSQGESLGDKREVAVWDLGTGNLIWEFPTMDRGGWYCPDGFNPFGRAGTSEPGETLSAAITPDGQSILTGHMDCALRIWELPTGNLIRTVRTNGGVKAIAVSPDGRHVLTGGISAIDREAEKQAMEDNGYPWLWDVETGQLVKTFRAEEPSIEDTHAVVFSPDGRLALSNGDRHGPKLWDLATGKLVRNFEKGSHGGGIAFTQNGLQVMIGCGLWEVASGKKIHDFSFSNTCRGESVAMFPGNRYALLTEKKGAMLVDLQSGKRLATLYQFNGGEWAVLAEEGYMFASPSAEEHLEVHLGPETFQMVKFHDSLFRPQAVKNLFSKVLGSRQQNPSDPAK